jgi:hypothetical protein
MRCLYRSLPVSIGQTQILIGLNRKVAQQKLANVLNMISLLINAPFAGGGGGTKSGVGNLAELETFHRLTENVRVHAVVVAERKLREIQRQIVGADIMEASDDLALEDASEAGALVIARSS